MYARIICRSYFAFKAPYAKTTGHKNAVGFLEGLSYIGLIKFTAVDKLDINKVPRATPA